MFKMIS